MVTKSLRFALICIAGAMSAGCVTLNQTEQTNVAVETASDDLISSPFSSTYKVPDSAPVLLKGARILVGNGDIIESADVLLKDGKIAALAPQLDAPSDAQVVDARGKWLTPGIIDVHSHMGVYPHPSIQSHADGNEAVSPNTAGVWAEHSVWPQDPNFEKAIQGGVTTVQILPGSANLFGGRSVVLKVVPSTTMRGMKFPDAPYGLKMACGENPKRVYGKKGGPSTRMGNMAGYRAAWIAAQQYADSWNEYDKKAAKDSSAKPPKRDLKLETLAGVLNGEILIHNHCYRADEMANMVALAKEFDYQISTFHHAVEAYKIAPLLAQENICSAVWADWWGFKQEAFDMVRENAALLDYAGACAIIHSDDDTQIQRLPQEAAKVIGAAAQLGISYEPQDAIRWLTSNAAVAIGLEDQIGTIEVGKNADVVLWSANPFSVYSKAEKVWIDGALRSDSSNPDLPPTSDFNLGIIHHDGDRP